MTSVVVDASAFAAVVFQEPEADMVTRRLDGAVVCAPTLLRYEITNVAWKKGRREPDRRAAIAAALMEALDVRWPIEWYDVNMQDVLQLSRATGLTTYDATYLVLAGSLGADLVTLDAQIVEVSAALLEM